MMNLALKLAETMRGRDPYGFDDAYDSIEAGAADFLKQLQNDPYEVIAQLLELIEADTM